MCKPYNLLLVEDDELTRAWIRAAIRDCPSARLLAESGSLQEAQQALEIVRPAGVFADIGLPDGSGLELVRHVRDCYPWMQVVVLTTHRDESSILHALEAGADGYLLKDGSQLSVCQLLDELQNGGAPVSPVVARYLFRHVREEVHRQLPPVIKSPLTRKETAIFSYLDKGYSAKEVAKMEGLSYYTVTTHIKNIYRKLGVSSRTQALHEAREQGILPR